MKIIRFNDEWTCYFIGEIKGIKEDSKTHSVGGG